MNKHSGFKFGKKMERKSWGNNEFDPKKEERKLMWVMIGTIVFMVVLALFMEMIKMSLTKG